MVPVRRVAGRVGSFSFFCIQRISAHTTADLVDLGFKTPKLIESTTVNTTKDGVKTEKKSQTDIGLNANMNH